MYLRVIHSLRLRTIIMITLPPHCMSIRIFLAAPASMTTSSRVHEQIVLLSSALRLLHQDPASISWLIVDFTTIL